MVELIAVVVFKIEVVFTPLMFPEREWLVVLAMLTFMLRALTEMVWFEPGLVADVINVALPVDELLEGVRLARYFADWLTAMNISSPFIVDAFSDKSCSKSFSLTSNE